MIQDPTPDDPIYKADHRGGRVVLRTVGGAVLEVEAPCVAYVAHDPDAESALQGPRLKSLVKRVEREDWAGGTTWLRVEARFDRRWDLPEALRSANLTPHESDVSPGRRLLSEHDGVRIARNTVDVFFDLECDSSVPLREHVEGKAPILLASYAPGLDAEPRSILLPALTEHAERDLLVEFRRRLRLLGCHLLPAWNGLKYDELVIKKRTSVLGLGDDFWDEFQFIDLMQCYVAHFGRGDSGDQRVSFALDAMAEALVGERKHDLRGALAERGIVVHPSRPAVTREAYDQAPDLLEWYGRHDVHLMQVLERKKRFLALQKTVASICRTPPSDRSFYKSELADGVLVRVGRATGVHFRNKPRHEEEQRQWQQAEGAAILEAAPPGLYEAVSVLDFAAMYPTIICGGNVSPECKVVEDWAGAAATHPNGARFRTDVEGIFPRVIRALRKRRSQAKERAKLETDPSRQIDVAHESDSLKIVANSFYGLMLARYSRYYDKVCGEAVTTSGQELLKILTGVYRDRGGRVLMGDTDSALPQVPRALLLPCPKGKPGCHHADVAPAVAACVEWAKGRGWPGAAELAIEHESTFLKFLIPRRRGDASVGARKRYAGTATYYKGAHLDHPKLEVKGLEVMRADGMPLMRQLLGDVLAAAMLADATAPELRGLVDLARERVLSGAAALEDLVQRKGIHKPLADYAGQEPHVRVARRLVELGWQVDEGSKVEMVVTGRAPDGKLVAVHPSEWDGSYDRAVTWDEHVYEPTLEVLEVLQPSYDWAMLGAAGEVARQADMFSALRPAPPAAPPAGDADPALAPVVVKVGPKASRADVVRARLAVQRSPGRYPVELHMEAEQRVDVPLPGKWGCDPEALRARLGWTDQVRVAEV